MMKDVTPAVIEIEAKQQDNNSDGLLNVIDIEVIEGQTPSTDKGTGGG